MAGNTNRHDNHKQYIEANFVDGKMTNLKGTFR
jgi:hypothetical protein